VLCGTVDVVNTHQPRGPEMTGEPDDSYCTVLLSGEFSLISFTVTPN
jgi:hypothetical protein